MIFLARPESSDIGRFIPAEPLNQHLKAVAERAKQSLNLPTLPNAKNLSEWAELCGLVHDFGKYTSYFQNKLPPKRQDPPMQEYGNHAFISALLGAYVAMQRHSDQAEVALLVFLAIHRHHGHLVSPRDLLPQRRYLEDAPKFESLATRSTFRVSANQLRAINAQSEDINNSPFYNQIVNEMNSLSIIEVQAFLNFEDWWTILSDLQKQYLKMERQKDITFYWQLNLLFSALIDADKHISAAASQGKESEVLPRFDLPSQLIDSYIRKLPNVQASSSVELALQNIRTSVYEEATQSIVNRGINELYPAVLSLTAPTGSGKTLTALGCAFRLRERVKAEYGFRPRIIYALPFVNIINQNYDVTEQVLKQLENFETFKSSYLLKHHHLAPLAFMENEDRSNDDALLLTESWESEVVVTTFVQLLETLISNRNRSLKKLHNIAGSIIILDEVQSIPYEQWRLIEHVLSTLTKHLGCTVLQMTATKPQIFQHHKALELLNKSEQYFQDLSRTKLVPRLDITNLDDLRTFVLDELKEDVSMLVVVNTIKTSLDLYEVLAQEFEGYHEFRQLELQVQPIVYLSTNITPWQRQKRVSWLKEFMKKGGKPLVISTQVVEAGVDLDFDVVIRDLGPLDSIVQVAGRCNRNGQKGAAKPVYIVCLERENRKLDAQLVYDRIMPQISKEILIQAVDETELFEKIEKYFEGCKRLNDDKSDDFIDAVNKLHYEYKEASIKSVSDYAFIESYEQVPIIIEVNEEAKQKVEELEQLYIHGGTKHQFREVYKVLGGFTISPSLHKVKAKERENSIFRKQFGKDKENKHAIVVYGEVWASESMHYNLETGFIWKDITPIF